MGLFNASSLITDAVQKMYEAFPYPNYSLVGRPRWQEGYLGASYFAGKLFEDLIGVEAAIHAPRGQFVREGRNILIAGSGEASPYILRKLEPSKHRLLCVDLSHASLRRARLRLATTFRPTEFIRSDINQFLRRQATVSGPFNHVDVYGVLHHLANPSETLRLMANHLSPRGTMRVMVYNKQARHWIHSFQSIARLLKLNSYEKKDRDFFRSVCRMAAEASPNLRDKFERLGSTTLATDSRLVDTFFHAREAKLTIADWFRLFEKAGLKAYALLDRYGELDDLENPLWKVPDAEELNKRASNFSFQNNLEVYLCRADDCRGRTPNRRYGFEMRPRPSQLLSYFLKTPPIRWFDFPETEAIGWRNRFRIWHKYIEYTSKSGGGQLKEPQRYIAMTAMQRLARMGVLFPGQIEDPNLRDILMQPITHAAEPVEKISGFEFKRSTLAEFIEAKLREKSLYTPRRLHLITERLNRSQT